MKAKVSFVHVVSWLSKHTQLIPEADPTAWFLRGDKTVEINAEAESPRPGILDLAIESSTQRSPKLTLTEGERVVVAVNSPLHPPATTQRG